jgi:hypothetical protein
MGIHTAVGAGVAYGANRRSDLDAGGWAGRLCALQGNCRLIIAFIHNSPRSVFTHKKNEAASATGPTTLGCVWFIERPTALKDRCDRHHKIRDGIRQAGSNQRFRVKRAWEDK